MLRTAVPALALLVLAGCAGDPTTAPSPASAIRSPVTSQGATHTPGLFFARAACTADIGFDIWFGGPRVLVEHASAKSITRSFRVQEFQGWLTAVNASNYQQVAPAFEVLGGAEMFNIKPDENGVLQVRIHEGTLVFAALDGSYNVVARHIIRTLPSQGPVVNEWRCRVVG